MQILRLAANQCSATQQQVKMWLGSSAVANIVTAFCSSITSYLCVWTLSFQHKNTVICFTCHEEYFHQLWTFSGFSLLSSKPMCEKEGPIMGLLRENPITSWKNLSFVCIINFSIVAKTALYFKQSWYSDFVLTTFCFSGGVFGTVFVCSSALSAFILAANFADVLFVSAASTQHTHNVWKQTPSIE